MERLQRPVAIVGAGKMGRGIALAAALAGLPARLVDADPAVATAARDQVLVRLSSLAAAGWPGAAGKEHLVAAAASVAAGVDGVPMVIEAIPEDLALKQALFARLDQVCPNDVYLATNTSTLRMADVFARVQRPERTLGVHWMSPTYVSPIVEVIPGPATLPAALAFARGWLEAAGKVPIVLKKDVPGFLVNRVQHAMLLEAMRLVDEGAADPEVIDQAVRLAIGLRLPLYGPFGANDLLGDKRRTLNNLNYLAAVTGEARFQPPAVLAAKVAAGETGPQAGRGWYDYQGVDPAALELERDRLIAAVYRTIEELGFHRRHPLAR